MSLLDSITPGFLLDAAQTVAVVVLWLRKPGQDAAGAVERLSNRVAVMDEHLKHMPSATALAELEGAVEALKASLDGIAAMNETLRTALGRVETYLLTHRTR